MLTFAQQSVKNLRMHMCTFAQQSAKLAYSSTTVCQKSKMTEILTFYNWHSGRLSYESTRVHNIEVFGLTDRLGGKE